MVIQRVEWERKKRVIAWRLRYWRARVATTRVFRRVSLLPRRVKAIAGSGLFFVALLTFVLHSTFGAAAQTFTLDAETMRQGNYEYGNVNVAANGTLSLQNSVAGSWQNDNGPMLPTPTQQSDWQIARGMNGTMYFMGQGQQSSCVFYHYIPETKEMEYLKRPPEGCGQGFQLVADGQGTLYYMPANNLTRLFSYSIATSTWTELATAPSQISNGATSVYVGGGSQRYLYVLKSGGSTVLLRYNITTNAWQTRSNFPAQLSTVAGFGMTWDGNDTIYAISADQGEFKSYKISTDVWTSISRISPTCQKYAMDWVNGKLQVMKLWWCNENTYLDTYDPTANTWTSQERPRIGGHIHDAYLPFQYDGTRYGYAIMGSDLNKQVFIYDFQTSRWLGESTFDLTQSTDAHHYMPVYDGSQYMYYIAGVNWGNIDRVYKKDVVTGAVSILASGQLTTSGSWVGAYAANALYYTGYDGQSTFQKFDLATNSWSVLAGLPAPTGWGATVTNGGDGYLYTTFRTSSLFYRYNIATNTWSPLTAVPGQSGPGVMMSRIGRTLYYLRGNSSGDMYSYNMDTNVWTELSGAPMSAASYESFGTTDGSRYLYYAAHDRNIDHPRRMFRYDTVTDKWVRIADMPTTSLAGASAIWDPVRTQMIVFQGFRSPRLWKWQPGAATYATAGTWYSKTMDLKHVASWTSLASTVSGTGATISTRTSSNGQIWDAWNVVSGTSITSAPNRYLQIKVDMTGPGTSTPSVSGLSLQYTMDTTAPGVPSSLAAQASKSNTQALNSGVTYEHEHPYFTWSGATDNAGGSGIDGYYVYFGLDSNADPAVDGSYQKTASYDVKLPMTAGEIYYLRLKTKDAVGNVSSAATFFSYRYFYISPPGTATTTSDADFIAGTNTNLDISGGGMRLRKNIGGTWSDGGFTHAPDYVRNSPMAVVGDYLYMLGGRNTTNFWRFNLVSRAWQTLPGIPAVVDAGSSMTWDKGNYLYAARGNNTPDFYRFDIVNQIWTTMPNLPVNAQGGTDITYIGNNMIALFYGVTREFEIFNIQTGSFVTKLPYPYSNNWQGSGIWYDGADSIYTYLGGTGDANNRNRISLVKYSIANDSWRDLAPPSTVFDFTQNNLVGDGHGGLYVFGSSYANTDGALGNRAMRYDIAKDSWEYLPDYPGQSYQGSVTSDGDRYLYIAPNNADSVSATMYRYDTWDKKFVTSRISPEGHQRVNDAHVEESSWRVGRATSSTWDGKYMYVVGSDQTTDAKFIRYNPATGETRYLPAPPKGVSEDVGTAYTNGAIYYMTGRARKDMYRFTIASETWERMADVPQTVNTPGNSTFIGLGDGTLLAMIGNNSRFVYRFTPDASIGTWTRLSDTPGTQNRSAMAYDSATNTVYALRCNNSTEFYKYTVGTNTWTTLAALPGSCANSASMVYSNGKVYATRGSNTIQGYTYDVSSNSWTSGPDAPERFDVGAFMQPINANEVIASRGDNAGDFYTFVLPGASTSYEGSAVHVSQPIQVSGLFDFAGIRAQVTEPAGTRVEFFTRTSTNGVTWDGWMRTSETSKFSGQSTMRVASAVKKYIQIKVVLESDDNINTPSVDSYALDYYYDVDPPNNPSVVAAYQDNTDTTVLANNTWYNYAAPHFDWPDAGQAGGPTDGPLGSNIKGYYVYFGTDNTAQPVTAGTFVSTSDYVPQLTNPGIYYLRIQAVDITGNVATSVFAPFVYKFDNQPPTVPSLVTVTPAGFTGLNNFSFQWPNGFDAHSGIKEYCYHTGATSGPFANEICQTGRELTDVSAAYLSGTNAFYVRVHDAAGNYSVGFVSASFYYSTDPPSPVTNLRAVPPVSAQNLFAFIWDLPTTYSGDPDQLEYCYSVNVLPSPTNTACSAQGRFIAPFKAATQQGTNLLYLVAKDEAGNVNWNSYASAIFIANTVSPGIPLNLTATDSSDRNTNRWSATLTWDRPTFEGNGIVGYVVERSEDQHTFTVIGNTSTRAFVDLDVLPNATYYYRVRAADGVDNRGGPSGIVAMTPKGNYAQPPKIVVSPTSQAGFDNARVTWATDRASTSFIYFGTNPNDLSQSKGSLDTVLEHNLEITGLQPNASYYYRVQSFDTERSYDLAAATSQIYTFRTTESARIFGVVTSDTALTSTVVTWKSTVPMAARIEYGPTLEYGLSASLGEDAFSSNNFLKLPSLSPGTTYHYRIIGRTDIGSVVRSDDYMFTTLSRPSVANVKVQPVEDAATISAKVSWTTNVPTTSTLRYEALGVQKEVSLSDLVTSHEITIPDLAGSIDYIFTIEGRDGYGNLATADRQKWRSTVDTRPPKLDQLSVNVTTTDGIKGTKAQLIVTWHTDEPATTQLRYGLQSAKLDQLTPLDTEPTTTHTVIVSDLNVSEIYKIQPISRDISGNTSTGSALSVVTPDKEVNIFDSILKALQKVFRL